MEALWSLFRWWLWLEIIGWAAFPLAWWFFRPFGDRGFALTKPLGLLVWGYLFWLGTTLGLLHNTFGGALMALLLLAVASYAATRADWRLDENGQRPFWRWVREHWRRLGITEGLFLVAYLGWAYVRAHSPDISTAGGEKFMEIAFINGILTSPRFPPHDPWLAGYAISYYYFGYVMVAALIRLSGVPASVGFNLAGATWFALTWIAAYGVIGNWVGRILPGAEEVRSRFVVGWGIVGGTVLTLIGNLEGFLEVLYARRLLPISFWQWLDIRSINAPYNPAQPPSWVPTRFIWWWQASRVIHDKDLLGNTMEVIDEFPAFSFILGDMHPHVLALPFVLLAIAGMLSLFWWRMVESEGWSGDLEPVSGVLKRGITFLAEMRTLLQRHSLSLPRFVLYALLLGALAFLNTWDFPIYLALLMGVIALRVGNGHLSWDGLRPALIVGGSVAFLGVLLYVPFYVGFQSQAGGILPNLFNPTRFPQFFVMFGPLLILLLVFVYVEWRTGSPDRANVLRWLIVVWILPWVFLVSIVGVFFITPAGQDFLQRLFSNPQVQANVGGRNIGQLALFIAERRLHHPGTFLIVGVFLAWVLSRLSSGSRAGSEPDEPDAYIASRFGLLLIALGLLLTYAVEFVYLKDLFNTRMNTVFKFYFQAWVLWSLAGVYGLAWTVRELQGGMRVWWLGVAVLFLALGSVYTALAIPARSQLQQAGVTLDGEAWVARVFPDDEAGIRWVRAHVPGTNTVLEATGGSYSFFGRVSAFTGRPTLLGWDFHELQWRGAALSRQAGSRAQDIERIYKHERGQALLDLLRGYRVAYLVVGSQERQKYGITPARERIFDQILDLVFEQGTMRIYRVP